jgi:hypothetical protein
MKMKKIMLFATALLPIIRMAVLAALSAALPSEAFVFSLSPEAPDEICFRVRTNACTVQTKAYSLAADVYAVPPVAVTAKSDGAVFSVNRIELEEGGKVYTSDFASAVPRLHILRIGSYFTQFNLENIVLKSGTNAWPGLVELSVYCHADRVYWAASFICNKKDWVVRSFGRRGTYVYKARDGFTNCDPRTPTAVRLVFQTSEPVPAVTQTLNPVYAVSGRSGVLATLPRVASCGLVSGGGTEWMLSATNSALGGTWPTNHIFEIGAMTAFAPEQSVLEQTMTNQLSPLTTNNISVSSGGSYYGFSAKDGLYKFDATIPSGIGGVRFTASNSGALPRDCLIEQETIGGISGTLLLDGVSNPVPVVIQHSLNFSGEAAYGEVANATQIYPLALAAGGSAARQCAVFRDKVLPYACIWLNCLEAGVDDAAPANPRTIIFQTMMCGNETHTTRVGDEQRITDFRPHEWSRGTNATAHSALVKILEYDDAAGIRQYMEVTGIRMIEQGPFINEFEMTVWSTDGKVGGTIRRILCTHSDHNRIFDRVNLYVRETVALSTNKQAPLVFYQLHRDFPPVRYAQYAFMAASGAFQVGSYSSDNTVFHNGTVAASLPAGFMFDAGYLSTRAGNPGYVFSRWDVRLNGTAVAPGVLIRRSNDTDRVNGIVPALPIQTISGGSYIGYDVMSFTGGNEFTRQELIEEQAACWRGGLTVTAETGRVVENFPPKVRAINGRAVFTVQGGQDYVPVRVCGLAQGAVQGRVTAGNGTPVEMTSLWYNAWPDGDRMGISIPVWMGTNQSVRIEVSGQEDY